MYYLNDDNDFVQFYPAPLAKMDRLTLTLINPRGEVVSFADSDVCVAPENNQITESFYTNTFEKDLIMNINDAAIAYRPWRVPAPVSPATDNPDKVGNDYVLIPPTSPFSDNPALQPTINKGDYLVNLSNQVQYIFEVKTQEDDVTNEIRPSILI
jgi:hypothetical protein